MGRQVLVGIRALDFFNRNFGDEWIRVGRRFSNIAGRSGPANLKVSSNQTIHRAIFVDTAICKQDGAGAEGSDGGHVVADEEDGAAAAGDFSHFAEAFLLE